MPHRWGISHHPHAKILDNGLRLWLLSSITKWWLGRDGDAFWEREKEKWGGVEDGSNEIKLWSLRWNRGIRNFEEKKKFEKKKKENSKKKKPIRKWNVTLRVNSLFGDLLSIRITSASMRFCSLFYFYRTSCTVYVSWIVH